MSSYLALKIGYINKTHPHIHKVELKTFYFNFDSPLQKCFLRSISRKRLIPCEHCKNSNVYSTLIMKCPKCFWHDNYKICPICDHPISEERNYIKEGFLRCYDCRAITYKNVKTLETNFYSPSKEDNEKED